MDKKSSDMTEAPVEARYLTLKQAGQYCGGKTAGSMRMMARRGTIPVIAFGRRLHIDRLELDKIMAARTIKLT